MEDFVMKVRNDIDDYDKTENKYDHSLVLIVCNIAESFFVQYKTMGVIKKEAVIHALKPYFNDDTELLSKLIDFVYPQIKKSNILRRNRSRLYSAGIFFWNMYGIKSQKN